MTSALHAADVSRDHQPHHNPSRGLPTVATPDDDVDPQWPRRLAGRSVTVLMDAHPAGRATPQRIAANLEGGGATVAVVDFAPHRHHGYGLTDWLEDRPTLSDTALRHLVAPTTAQLTRLVAA